MTHLAYKLEGSKYNLGGEEPLVMMVSTYGNDRPAIVLMDEVGLPYCKFTINLPEVPLGPDEILVKTCDENADVAEMLRASSAFKDTLRRVKSGFNTYEIWKVELP